MLEIDAQLQGERLVRHFRNEIRTDVLLRLGCMDDGILEPSNSSESSIRDELDRHIIQLAGIRLPKAERITFFWLYSSFNWEQVQEKGLALYGREWTASTVRQYGQNAKSTIADTVTERRESHAAELWSWATATLARR